MNLDQSGIFLAGAHKKARTPRIAAEGIYGKIRSKKAVSRTRIQAIDLISEGEIDGIVSGTFYYSGQTGDYGYISGRFEPFSAFSVLRSNPSSEITVEANDDVRWLKSIYWNDIPLVDSSDQLNFPNIDVAFVRGTANGVSNTDQDDSFARQITRRATETRNINERLRGPNFNYSTLDKGHSSPTETYQGLINSTNPNDNKRATVNAKKYRILNKNCTEVQVNIRINSLQYRELTNPKKLGDARDQTIAYNIQVTPVFHHDSFVPDTVQRTFVRSRRKTVRGRVTKGVIDTTSIVLPNMSARDDFLAWEVIIIRETFDSIDSRYENTTFVDSLTEVYSDSYSYPHSAIVSSKFSAENFSQIPARSFDVRLMKVKVPSNYNPILRNYGQISGGAKYYGEGLKPNGQFGGAGNNVFSLSYPFVRAQDLSVSNGGGGSPTTQSSFASQDLDNDYYSSPGETVRNINGLSEQELGDYTVNGTTDIWDGSFKSEKQWTDNPAWVFYDLLTNKRYGLGDYINEEDIDKWTLFKVGQYCDELVPDGEGGLEPRFSANILINKRDEAFDVVNDISSIFRGIAYYGQGSVFVTQDILKDPIYLFNNSNVINGNFAYSSTSRKARHNVVIVRYLDRNNFYTPAVEYVKDVESIKRYGEREVETTAYGATSKSQALRWGRWTLFTENLQTETVSFLAGVEASYLKPGDVFKVQDNNRSDYKFGGRISGMRIDTVGDSPLSANEALGAVITLDRYIDFKGLKNEKGEDMGTGVLSVLAPRYYYEPINTDITDSSYVDEIRTQQFFQYNIYTGNSLNTDADGYVSKQIGASGEYVNGLTEIILTGATYRNNPINVDNFNLNLNSSNYTDTPFSFTIHDFFNNEPKEKIYSVLSSKETEFYQYEILGMEYSTGKYDLIEEEFALGELSPHLSSEPPKLPILEVNNIEEGGVRKIKFVAKLPQKLENGIEFNDPDHNTIALNLYMTYEPKVETAPGGTIPNAFDEEQFAGNPAENSDYEEVLLDIVTIDGANDRIEGEIDGSRAPGRYSFALFSMNWHGEFSDKVSKSAELEASSQQAISDIIVYGLELNDDSRLGYSTFQGGYGDNKNYVVTDATTMDIEWQVSSTTDKSFEEEYGYLTVTKRQAQGRSTTTKTVLPTASQLKYLVTIRATADSFTFVDSDNDGTTDVFVGTPSNLIYNFKSDWSDDNNIVFKDFRALRSDCTNPSVYIKDCFDVVEDQRTTTHASKAYTRKPTTVTVADRILQMGSFAIVNDFKTSDQFFVTNNNSIKNYLYEYGPPREYDVVVEVINSETTIGGGRITSSSSEQLGINKYNLSDLILQDDNDPGSFGLNSGFDRLTIRNKRLPHFFLQLNGQETVDIDSVTLPAYDSNEDYSNKNLDKFEESYVSYNNKIYVLLQTYGDERTPGSEAGFGYWLCVSSIVIALVKFKGKANLKAEITPKNAIYYTPDPVNGSLTLTKKQLRFGFFDELFKSGGTGGAAADIENGGFTFFGSNYKTLKTVNGSENIEEDIFDRSDIYTAYDNQDFLEQKVHIPKTVTVGEEGENIITEGEPLLQDFEYGDIPFIISESMEDASDDRLKDYLKSYTVDLTMNTKYIAIGMYDAFDQANFNTPGLNGNKYKVKSIPYSNVVQTIADED